MDDDRPDLAPIKGDQPNRDERAQSLEARLKAARAREAGESVPESTKSSDASYRAGNRVLGDLIGGITGGLFLGWVIDQFAGTQPWGLLGMMFFGIFVAFRNIIRNSRPGQG